jgi:hypothetical protein
MFPMALPSQTAAAPTRPRVPPAVRKDVELANLPGATLVEVADAAQRGIQRVCASDDLVAGFLAHTGLALDDEPST